MTKLMFNWKFTASIAVAIFAAGCSATSGSSSMRKDDLYGSHDINALKEREIRQREAAVAAREADIARREENAAMRTALASEYEEEPGYHNILVDNYEDSYERRLRGYESGGLNAPLSGNAASSFRYASAFDPAYYNIVVIGDDVWVEPRYVSSLFGYTGTSNPRLSVGIYGWNSWNSPWGWNSWNSPWGWNNWGPSWGWNSHWGWGSNWGGGWGPGWGPSWGWNNNWGFYPNHGHRPNRPNNNVIVGRPRYSQPSGPSYGGSTYRRAGSVNSTGAVRPAGSVGSGSGSSYRRGSTDYVSPGVSTRPSTSTPSTGGSYRRESPANVSPGGATARPSQSVPASSGGSGSSYRRESSPSSTPASSGSSRGSSYSSPGSSSGSSSGSSGGSYRSGGSSSPGGSSSGSSSGSGSSRR